MGRQVGHFDLHSDGSLSIGDMPLCPLCDQPMWSADDVAILAMEAGGHGTVIALGHLICAQEELEDDEEEEDEDGGDDEA